MANVTKKAIIDVEMNSLDADQRARAKRSAIIDIDIFGLSEVVEVGQTRFQGAFIGSVSDSRTDPSTDWFESNADQAGEGAPH